jgi:hypothetical protein
MESLYNLDVLPSYLTSHLIAYVSSYYRGYVNIYDTMCAYVNVLDLNAITIDVNTHCHLGNCPNTHNKAREHMSTLALGKYDLFSSIVKASDVYARIGTDA